MEGHRDEITEDDHVVPIGSNYYTFGEMLCIRLTCQVNVMRECRSLLKQGKL